MEKNKIKELLQSKRNFKVTFLVAGKYKKHENAKLEGVNIDTGFATFRRFNAIKDGKQCTGLSGSLVVSHEKGMYLQDISTFSLPISQIVNLKELE